MTPQDDDDNNNNNTMNYTYTYVRITLFVPAYEGSATAAIPNFAATSSSAVRVLVAGVVLTCFTSSSSAKFTAVVEAVVVLVVEAVVVLVVEAVVLFPSSRSSLCLCSFWEDANVAAFVVSDTDAADAEVVDAEADAADVVVVMAVLGGKVAVIAAIADAAATAEAAVDSLSFLFLSAFSVRLLSASVCLILDRASAFNLTVSKYFSLL